MHTARAPMASALTMSVPRRKPLSIRMGMRPAAASTMSGRASMVAPPPSSAAAVVGDDDTIKANLGCELGVLRSEDALEHNFRARAVAQPLDVVPGEVGSSCTGGAPEVNAFE